MVVTLVSLALVALARCILNRSKVERVREQVENIIHSQLQHENHCQLIQPMLGEHSLLQLQQNGISRNIIVSGAGDLERARIRGLLWAM